MAHGEFHGGDRFGGQMSTPQRRMSTAQKRNQANTNRYKLGDYQADRRFKNSGAITPRPGNQGPDWSGAAGMFSNRDPGRFPEGDLAYQEGLGTDIWQKTTPDVNEAYTPFKVKETSSEGFMRARDNKGQYVGDDKATPDVNEAYTKTKRK